MPEKIHGIEMVVDSDGELLIYTKGHLAGPYALKQKVRNASLLQREVQLVAPYGDTVVASLDDPENALAICAALVAAAPGRTTILDAPDAVWDFLQEQEDKFGEGDNYDAMDDESVGFAFPFDEILGTEKTTI